MAGGLAPGWSQQQQLCDVTAPVQHTSTPGTWEDKQNTKWVVGSELRSHPFLSTLQPSEKAGAKQPSISWTHLAVYLVWGRTASPGTRSESEDNSHCLCLPLLHSGPPTAPRSVRASVVQSPVKMRDSKGLRCRERGPTYDPMPIKPALLDSGQRPKCQTQHSWLL